jgi:hypothetical protein
MFDHIHRRFEKPQPLRLECWRCQSPERVKKTAIGYLPLAERRRAADAGDGKAVPLCAACRMGCAY